MSQNQEAPQKRRPCIILFRDFLRSKCNAAVVGGIAGFQMVSALAGIVLVCLFPSITDVAITIFNVRWVHIASLVPLLLSGLLGMATAWTRKNILCRWYFFSMVVSFVCPWLLTFTWFRLLCECSSFRQCNALQSFHDISGGEPYVNPWPAPEGANKFEHLRNLKFMDPPRSLLTLQQNIAAITHKHSKSQSNQNDAASQLQAKSQGQARGRVLPGKTGRSVSMRKRRHQMITSPQGDTIVPGSDDAIAEDEIKNRSHQSNHRRRQMQAYVDEVRSANQSPAILQLTRSLQVKNESFVEVAHLHGERPEFHPPEQNNTKINKSLAKRVGKIADMYNLRHAEELIHSSPSEACSTKKVMSDRDLLADTWRCRREKKGCPNYVITALLDCVTRPQCDVVKITSYSPLVESPADNTSIQDDDDRNTSVQDDADNTTILYTPTLHYSLLTGMKKPWTVITCLINHPVTTGWDANHQKEPYSVYFERDRHMKMMKDDATMGLLIHEQEQKNETEWLEYMLKKRDGQCVCDPKQDSCMAHSSNPSAERGEDFTYWCAIDKKHAEHCRGQPRVSDMQLHPSRPNTYWSKDLCTKRGCKCKRGLGLRVSSTEKNLLEEVQKSTEEESVIIGWKCQKWFKDDEMPWCVVGFDSPCADRKARQLGESDATNLRIYTSAIPCQDETMALVTYEAAEICWGLRWFFMVMEVWRILISIPLFYIVYRFLKNHCMDDSTTDTLQPAFRMESDDLAGGDRLTIMSESELEDSPVETEDKKEKKQKKKPQKKKKKKRESSWDDSWSD